MKPLLRSLAWALFWVTLFDHVVLPLLGVDAAWVHLVVTFAAAFIASGMTRRRSLRWRWAYLRHWEERQRPLVYNEDQMLMGAVLPGETMCVIGDTEGPLYGHVHTRTLLLGRARLRSETTWRQP